MRSPGAGEHRKTFSWVRRAAGPPGPAAPTSPRFARLAGALALAVLAATAWPAPARADDLPRDNAGCVPAGQKVVSDLPWAQRRLGADRAWPLSRGAGVTIAVLGTGVSADPPSLAGALLPGLDVTGAAVGPADAVDCGGRGTFVAGLAAGRQLTGVGFAGVAPAATVLPVRVLKPSATTGASSPVAPAVLARGIVAAADAGARVIAVPVVTGDAPELRAAVEHATGRNALVVAAAYDGKGPGYPANYPGVLSVAGVGPNGGPAESSQYGRVDLLAPGEKLIGPGPIGPGHHLGSGSWAAVGFVAGATALLAGYLPTLTAAELAARLTATADRAGTLVGAPPGAAGSVDPVRAVADLPGPTHRPVASAAPVRVPAAPVGDPGPLRAAGWLALAALGVVLLGAGARVAGRRAGRTR